MTQQLITINSQTAIKRYGDEGQIRMEMQILRAAVPGLNAKKRVKVNGRWVDSNEFAIPDELVLALYIAKRSSGLSPERGEIYATPNGLYVAAKVRAYDAITAAAKRGETLSMIFKTLAPDTPAWRTYANEYSLDSGDTVRLLEVVSNKRHNDWLDQRAGYIRELKLLDYDRKEIVQMVNEKYGTMCEPMAAIGVVKATENLGDTEYETGEINKKKAALYSRADRADKRALSRWIAKYGYAAPDTRSYGGAPVSDDIAGHDQAIETEYKVVPGVRVEEPAEPGEEKAQPEPQNDNATPEPASQAEDGIPTFDPPAESVSRTKSLRKQIDAKAAQYSQANKDASDRQRSVGFLLLKEACGNDDTKRHTIQHSLTGFEKWDQIPGPYVLALIEWLKPYENGDRKYHPSKDAIADVEKVLSEALANASQQQLPLG